MQWYDWNYFGEVYLYEGTCSYGFWHINQLHGLDPKYDWVIKTTAVDGNPSFTHPLIYYSDLWWNKNNPNQWVKVQVRINTNNRHWTVNTAFPYAGDYTTAGPDHKAQFPSWFNQGLATNGWVSGG